MFNSQMKNVKYTKINKIFAHNHQLNHHYIISIIIQIVIVIIQIVIVIIQIVRD